MNDRLAIGSLLGKEGPGLEASMEAGSRWLRDTPETDRLRQVGRIIDAVPACQPIDKSALQDSYGGSQTTAGDDFLVGQGLFYLTEQRRLFLDATSGHYQMLWGYQHPELCQALNTALQRGVVWDNHSNIPQAPVKQLARRLVTAANATGESDPLDTVLLGVCTGSVACAAALKIQLKVYQRDKQGRGKTGVPAIVSLKGNYHGSDMVPQCLRGMWPGLVSEVEVVEVEPNDFAGLETAFRTYGERIAGFWAEPVMMNREALAVEPAFLQAARRCCDQAGALMCMDEIQTGFWRPEIFEYRTLGFQPDLVVLGKGMTAGFHPHSAVLLKERHDVLEQYDAISTNGSAALPCYMALCSLELIALHERRLRETAAQIEAGIRALADEFPGQIQSAQGRGYLAGLKFHRVEAALDFQRRAVASGLWVRAHAYHAGHSTVLTKLGLSASVAVVDYLMDRFRELLRSTEAIPERRP